MRRTHALALVAALAIAGAACIPRFSRGEPPPRALLRYLDALVAGDLEAAYEATQLREIGQRAGTSASLSLEHFIAFHRASPLQRYSFARVTRIGRISIEAPAQSSPFFDVDVDLTFADGTRRENFGVEGEVLGTVQVEPDLVRASLPGDRDTVEIDGIQTRIARTGTGKATHALLLLRGRHTIGGAGAPVTVWTEPLEVLDGPGEVVEDPDGRYLAFR